jgi:hypothetical protein
MASVWSDVVRSCGQDRTQVQIPTLEGWQIASSDHAAVLEDADRFDTLHRKDGFFDEGIITIFGVTQGVAELQSFRFRPSNFTPTTAKQWLAERGFMPLLFVEGDAA